MTINVLLATHYLEGREVAEAIEAIDPRITVSSCRYTERPEQRRARAHRRAAPFCTEPTHEQRAAFARADVLVALDLPADLPQLAPRLRWCHLISSGTGHVTGSGLPAPGLALTHSPGGNAPGVAEFVLARLLEHAKLLPDLAAQQRNKTWAMAPGSRVEGLTLAIVGYGHIGREVAGRARAFGMNVIGVVRRMPEVAENGVEFCTDLERGISSADVVVLCASDQAENNGLIDDQAFAAMKPGALFVNVARGALVDEQALLDAMRSGHLAAAALDVTDFEPLPPEHPFWEMPNVRLSCHSASTQDGMLPRRLAMFTANLTRWLAGKPLCHLVRDFSSTNRPGLP
jgi:phosphoglycerate dehydrogenase-like enzyme